MQSTELKPRPLDHLFDVLHAHHLPISRQYLTPAISPLSQRERGGGGAEYIQTRFIIFLSPGKQISLFC